MNNVFAANTIDGNNDPFHFLMTECFRESVKNYNLSEAQKRWDYRKKLSFKIGEPRYAMAGYGKVNRITFPLGDEAVILVTTELDVYVNKLVDEIIEIRHNLEHNILGFSTR